MKVSKPEHFYLTTIVTHCVLFKILLLKLQEAIMLKRDNLSLNDKELDEVLTIRVTIAFSGNVYFGHFELGSGMIVFLLLDLT